MWHTIWAEDVTWVTPCHIQLKRPYSAGWNCICWNTGSVRFCDNGRCHTSNRKYHFDWALGMGFLLYNTLTSNETGHSPFDWSQVGTGVSVFRLSHVRFVFYLVHLASITFYQPGNKSSFDNYYFRALYFLCSIAKYLDSVLQDYFVKKYDSMFDWQQLSCLVKTPYFAIRLVGFHHRLTTIGQLKLPHHSVHPELDTNIKRERNVNHPILNLWRKFTFQHWTLKPFKILPWTIEMLQFHLKWFHKCLAAHMDATGLQPHFHIVKKNFAFAFFSLKHGQGFN